MFTLAGSAAVALVAVWGVFQYEQDTANERQKNAADIEVAGQAIKTIQNRHDLDRFLHLRTLRRKIGLDLSQHREYCHLGRALYGADDFTCPAYDGKIPRSD